jgi:cell division protein FtsQ
MDPRIRQRRAEVARRHGRRRLTVILAAALVVALVVVGWEALHSTVFRATVVTVHSPAVVPASEVVTAAGLGDEPPLIDVNPGAVAAAVERLPWVARASVVRHWPDAVVVTVTARVAVVQVKAWTGTALVDGTGRVLADHGAAVAGLITVAVSGPDGLPGRPGSTLGAAGRAAVLVAATLPPAFRAQVTGVTSQDGVLHLTLTSPVTVDLGSTSALNQKYEDVAAILAGTTLHPGDIIDVVAPGAPTVTGP